MGFSTVSFSFVYWTMTCEFLAWFSCFRLRTPRKSICWTSLNSSGALKRFKNNLHTVLTRVSTRSTISCQKTFIGCTRHTVHFRGDTVTQCVYLLNFLTSRLLNSNTKDIQWMSCTSDGCLLSQAGLPGPPLQARTQTPGWGGGGENFSLLK